MNPQSLNKKISRLSYPENLGYYYLINKGIKIDLNSRLLYGNPDFLDEEGNGYEIKRTTYQKNHHIIYFIKSQLEKFKDSDRIIIFYPFSKEPAFDLEYGKIKRFITKKGCLSLNKLRDWGVIN